MKTIGVIAEFNPFHKGHEYFINEAKSRAAADAVVVVMSGDFVQRGEPALWDKFTRAKAAVYGGADLVLELPSPIATASAAVFAYGAVKLLDGLGAIDELWFGSEAGCADAFSLLADIISNEPDDYKSLLKESLKKGDSFPKARSSALCSYLLQGKNSKNSESAFWGNENALAEFLSSPNNILAVEYCAALKKLKSRIKPMSLKRQGAGYNDVHLNDLYSSAAAIRKAIIGADTLMAAKALPDFYASCFDGDLLKSGFVCADDLSLVLRYAIMRESVDSLSTYNDVGMSLAHRIKQLENEFTSFTDFAALLKSKNRTYTSISRALIHILLSIRQHDVEAALSAPYARILAIGKNKDVLGMIKKSASCALCPKPSDLKDGSYEKELFVSNLYESVRADKSGDRFVHEYTRQIFTL